MSFHEDIPENKYLKTKELEDSINCMCMNESGTEILYSYGEHSFVLWDIQKGLVVCDILCVKIKNDL